jgi:hypothetical protein
MSLPVLLRPAAALLALVPAWAAAASIGLFTIVDGEVALLRDTQRLDAAEGVHLHADDIVRTGVQTRLVRVELGDGTVLDLGPDTELLLPRAGTALQERGPTAYLARGWLKLTNTGGATNAGVASGTLDLRRVAGTALLRLGPDVQAGFVESGAAELVDRGDARNPRTQPLREGDAFARHGNEPARVVRHMPAELLQGLPRAFVDSLPRRTARFAGTAVEPHGAGDVSYADVAYWLNGDASLRPQFVARFTPLARQRDFRAKLVADMRNHPEWDKVLFPEKYRPKPVVVAARRPTPAPAAASAAAAAVAAAAKPAEAPLHSPVAVNLQGLMTWPGAPRQPNSASTLETR